MTYAEAMVYTALSTSIPLGFAWVIVTAIKSQLFLDTQKQDGQRSEMIRALAELAGQVAKINEPKVPSCIPEIPKPKRPKR